MGKWCTVQWKEQQCGSSDYPACVDRVRRERPASVLVARTERRRTIQCSQGGEGGWRSV